MITLKLTPDQLPGVTVQLATDAPPYLAHIQDVTRILHALVNQDSPAVGWVDLLGRQPRIAYQLGNQRLMVHGVPPGERAYLHKVGGSPLRHGRTTFPALVFVGRWDDDKLTKHALLCGPTLPTSVTDTATQLMSFPYGNVYAAGSAICWGAGHGAAVAACKHTYDMEDLFFSIPFNNDLIVTQEGTPDTGAFRSLGTWPDNIPLPLTSPLTITLGAVIRRMIDG